MRFVFFLFIISTLTVEAQAAWNDLLKKEDDEKKTSLSRVNPDVEDKKESLSIDDFISAEDIQPIVKKTSKRMTPVHKPEVAKIDKKKTKPSLPSLLNPDKDTMQPSSATLSHQKFSRLQPVALKDGHVSVFKDGVTLLNDFHDVDKERKQRREISVHELVAQYLGEGAVVSDGVDMNPFFSRSRNLENNKINPQKNKKPKNLNGVILLPYEILNMSKASLAFDRQAQMTGKYVYVEDFDYLDKTALKNTIQPYLGTIINTNLLENMIADIEEVVRGSRKPFASVFIPEQTVKGGVITLAIKQALLEDMRVAGNEHFSEKQISKQIAQKVSDPVDVKQLNDDLAWLNLHPNRRVSAAFTKGEDTGTTTTEIIVEDQKPWSVFASLSNSGTETLGTDQYGVGFSYNNLWSKDHKLSYQNTATLSSSNLDAHSLSYEFPFPWRHLLSLNYQNSEATADILNNTFRSEGKYNELSADYKIPLYEKDFLDTGWAFSDQFLTAGLAYKHSEGDVLFTLFGDPIATGLNTDVEAVNAHLKYNGRIEDPWSGINIVDSKIVFSPGPVGDNINDETAFSAARANTDGTYFYGSFSVERTSPLSVSEDWEPFRLVTFAKAQLTTDRLLGGERWLSAGQKGFRGYQPDAYSGDYGGAFAVDIIAPRLNLDNEYFDSNLSVSAFLDYGYLRNKQPELTEYSKKGLFSTGVQLDYELSDYLRSRLVVGHDLGNESNDKSKSVSWQLTTTY